MALSQAEIQELRDFILSKSCEQYRQGQPCVPRNGTTMVGTLHAPCLRVQDMLALVAKI